VLTVEDRLLHSYRVKSERVARTSAGPAALGAKEEREEKREREARVRDSLRCATTVTCRWWWSICKVVMDGDRREEVKSTKVLQLCCCSSWHERPWRPRNTQDDIIAT
jgi:hypothetical protein